ncbi:FecR domain-containing protein [Xylophilus sp. GW821-FHT01B05]
MSADKTPIDPRALREAAEWFAVLGMAPGSTAEQDGWRHWLAAAPAHRSAWARVEAVQAGFAPPRQLPAAQRAAAGAALDAATAQLRRRRLALRTLLVAGGGGVIAWAAVRHTPGGNWLAALGADHRTATGDTRRLELPGGGVLWLASATAIDLGDDPATPGGQRLRLRQGEVLVETGHGAGARPLVVETPHGRLHPLGTRFAVRLQDGAAQTLLAVFDGRVALRLARAAGGGDIVVDAGLQRAFSADAAGPAAPADPARAAWTRGVLLADDMPLDAFVAELARYRRGRLACAPDAAQLRVAGGFPLYDTDRALAMLVNVLPVQVRHTLPWWTTVELSRP